MQDTKLTPNFWLSETWESQEASRNGINNQPPIQLLTTLKRSAECMELVRAELGNVPIVPSSWYRSAALNKEVKGSKYSQHMAGEAIDFTARRFGTPVEIVKKLAASDIQFDQLILEHTWVHVSWAISSGRPRKQVLTLIPAKVKGQKASYVAGITDKEGKPL